MKGSAPNCRRTNRSNLWKGRCRKRTGTGEIEVVVIEPLWRKRCKRKERELEKFSTLGDENVVYLIPVLDIDGHVHIDKGGKNTTLALFSFS